MTPSVSPAQSPSCTCTSAGLDFAETGGHHVVVRDDTKPIDKPGNVCMISIASVWEPDMAPKGHHCIHAYTMEPFEGWER
jgi:phytoene dehydrogenase-like protein